MKSEHIISTIIYSFLMAGIVALWVFDDKLISLILFLIAIAIFIVDIVYFMYSFKEFDDYGD